MASVKFQLRELITQRREKYTGEDLPVYGVSADGFIPPKQKVADKSLYNVFYKNDFVFNPARMELNSIAYNSLFEKATCSSLYEVFYVAKPDKLLPAYLELFVKRREFARECKFIGWGSAREYCRIANINDIEIDLPPIDIQRKYVAIYNAMLENQRCYERGLDDLKLTCDARIEELMQGGLTRLKPLISQTTEVNSENNYDIDAVRGISIEKRFIPTKAKMDGVSLKNYLVVRPGDFAYVPTTSRNGGKISLANNSSSDPYICSSSYITFRSADENKLYPGYLKIILSRPEFDRYTRFNSWGSARETFDWDAMCDTEIPLPPIAEQRAIANIYSTYLNRRSINERLKAQLKDICPVLIKGSLEEASA